MLLLLIIISIRWLWCAGKSYFLFFFIINVSFYLVNVGILSYFVANLSSDVNGHTNRLIQAGYLYYSLFLLFFSNFFHSLDWVYHHFAYFGRYYVIHSGLFNKVPSQQEPNIKKEVEI